MDFKKIISLGVLSVTKITCGFLLFRYVNLYLGVGKLSLLGQVISVSAFVAFFASGGASRAYIYYSQSGNEPKYRLALQTILIYCSIAVGILVLFFAPILSNYLVGSQEITIFLRGVGLLSFLLAFNNIALAFSTFIGKQGVMSVINSIGLIISFILFIALISYFPNYYGVYPLIQAIVVATFFFLFLKRNTFFNTFQFKQLTKSLNEIRDLTSHSSAIVAYLLASFITLTFVRKELIINLGLETSGLWELAFKVSEGYLQFCGLIMIYLVLPSFMLKNNEQNTFIKYGLLFSMFLGVVFISMEFIGEPLFNLIFAIDSGLLVNSIVKAFVIADVFRIMYLLVQHYNLSQNRIRTFIGIEIVNIVLFTVILSFMPFDTIETFMHNYVFLYVILFLITASAAILKTKLSFRLS